MIQANRTFAAVDTIRAITEQLINCSRSLNQSLTEYGPRLREVKKLWSFENRLRIYCLCICGCSEVVLFGCC